jgi:CBS domain-containing protein
MECPVCAFDNIPGLGTCEECGASLTQEDIPLARAQSRVEQSFNEDKIEVLNPARGISVTDDTTLDVAIQTMREKHIGCVLITNGGGKLAGILTERDLLNRIAGREEDLSRLTVRQFMRSRPETIREDRLLAYALHRMMVGDFRHLPMRDKEGRPAGIISSRDIIDYLTSQFRQALAPDAD